MVVVKELDLHARDVDARWALALAGLAAHAQLERLAQLVRGECLRTELA
jgi:hypothetical protein